MAIGTYIDNIQNKPLADEEIYIQTLSSTLNYHIWLLNDAGAIIYDTSNMNDNNLSPDSFRQAMEGTGNLTITRNANRESFLTYASPVRLPGGAAGVLVVTSPISGINTAVRDMERTLFLRGALIVIAFILIRFYFARKLTKPIDELINATEEVGKGHYERIAVADKNNELYDLSVSFNEMTERLSQLDEEQKKLDTLKRDFLSNLSHELQTPLTTLEAFLEALKDGMVVNEEKKHQYVVALYEETMHLKRLASDLLQLARIESGHTVVENVSFDPIEAIRSVVHSRLEAAGKNGNSLLLSAVGDYPHIWCDRAHFRQIVANLINNAIQFTADGTITVAARLEEQFLLVSVTDNGIGIDPHEMPFIWNRFFKVDKARSRHHQESGLGLSIVKHLVELHHGLVGAESRPGEGSRFYFLLPLMCEIPLRPVGVDSPKPDQSDE
ncbi:MAG TPA: HAMP domain-containing sensor histidine kinase [Spirochaetia bacterium]|nr:HAMP domain-containing sensor histidine kinase [Spirochaetia bacterium]